MHERARSAVASRTKAGFEAGAKVGRRREYRAKLSGVRSGDEPDPMSLLVEALWNMTDVELIGAYYEARRDHVERKFARDTQRARLEWLRAKAFAAGFGGVSERRNTVELSDELARKGQEVREMTRDVDLAKADVDLIAMIVRMRGAAAETGADEEPAEDEKKEDSG
jgi:hypothetical protein